MPNAFNALLLKEKILNFVKTNGPITPTNAVKAVNENVLLVSAILSELVASKLIKISSAKIGTSPLYYAQGQESKLQMLYPYLPAKERELYDILKKNRVLIDKTTEPAYRVALRSLKDFAVPLTVKFNDAEKLFWKWYLISDEELNKKIEIILDLKEQVEPQEKENEIVEISSSEIVQEAGLPTVPTQQKQAEEKQIIKINTTKTKPKKRVRNTQREFNEFELLASTALSSFGVDIVSKDIKNKKEIDFIIFVPSKIGPLSYLVKAKNKKKINEADCSLAYNEGERNKLPVLFLTNGELTKKAKEYVEKQLRGYLIFRKLA